MPRNTTITIPARTWTLLTEADVSAVTFQITGSYVALIKGTAGTLAPTSTEGAIKYEPGQGERLVTLAELFPGVAGCNRLWAWTEWPSAPVMISHA